MVRHYLWQTLCITCVKQARCDHEGGRGLPGSFRVLYIYLHPPRNFFCTNVPRMGSVVRMVTLGGIPSHTHASHTPIPPRPPHSMASFPGVCVCSLIAPHAGYSTALLCYCVTVLPCKVGKRGAWLLCGYQAGDVSNQGNSRNPATIPESYVSNGL